jgi:hypothetical protein
MGEDAMTRIASITHSREGYAVEITEVPLRWLNAERAGEAFLAATGHILCCNLPDWTSRVRWGPLDEDGWTPRSLGYLLHAAGQRMACLTFRHESGRVRIPVTAEWVGEHYPSVREEFRFLEDGTGPDAMSVTFSDGTTVEPGSAEALAVYQEASNELRELTGD